MQPNVKSKGQRRVGVEPAHADVSYGEHEKQRFDLWLRFHDDLAEPGQRRPSIK